MKTPIRLPFGRCPCAVPRNSLRSSGLSSNNIHCRALVRSLYAYQCYGVGLRGRGLGRLPCHRWPYVIGVDPHPTKVDLINQGVAPIVEKDIGEIIRTQVAVGRLPATSDLRWPCRKPKCP